MTPLSVDLIVRMLFSALCVVSLAIPVSITGFDNETSERHRAFRVKSKKMRRCDGMKTHVESCENGVKDRDRCTDPTFQPLRRKVVLSRATKRSRIAFR